MQKAEEIRIQAEKTIQRKNTFFIENKGQWNDEVLYLARVGGMDAWITKTGVVYDFYKNVKQNPDENAPTALSNPKLHELAEDENLHRIGHVVMMQYENAQEPTPKPTNLQSAYHNYFKGNDQKRWASNVPLYGEVNMKQIYAGVDARYYFDGGGLRYDLIVSPGADVSKVQMNFNGADGVAVNSKGELTLKTALGDVTQRKLLAYQIDGSTKKSVECAFNVGNDGTVGFAMGEYDKTKPLVVDPIIYSTFLEGTSSERGHSVAIDAYDFAYVCGATTSRDFPRIGGLYDYRADWDIFVTKMDNVINSNTGNYEIVWSTFIGGAKREYAWDIALDPSNKVYITGLTHSLSNAPNLSDRFPTTVGAFDSINTAPNNIVDFPDAFAIKMSSDGNSLIYSTYLGSDGSTGAVGVGGPGNDGGTGIKVDIDGNAFITGRTSGNFPVTANSPAYSGGKYDAFVAKLNPWGTQLLFAVYIGGGSPSNSLNDDGGNAIALDINGTPYITGYTAGDTNFTTLPSVPYYSTEYHPFVAEFDKDNGTLIYSRVLAGNSTTSCGMDLTINQVDPTDPNFFILLTGFTQASDFPITTTTAIQSTFQGYTEAYLMKLNPNRALGDIVYSTFWGNGVNSTNGITIGYGVQLDELGNVYLSGIASNYPSGFGGSDMFLAKFDPLISQLTFSTYIGGSNNEADFANSEICTRNAKLAVRRSDEAYIVSTTQSPNFPTKHAVYPNYYQSANTNCHAFITAVDTKNYSRSIDLHVFLQGDYHAEQEAGCWEEMWTTLADNGHLLRLVDLYSNNHKSVIYGQRHYSPPPGAVCWVGLEFRTETNATSTYDIGAFLMSDGSIVSANGGPLQFTEQELPYTNGIYHAKYYIVIKEKRHLSIMTSAKVDLIPYNNNQPVWDFRYSQSSAYMLPQGNPHRQDPMTKVGYTQSTCSEPVFGMIAGDVHNGSDVFGSLISDGVVATHNFAKNFVPPLVADEDLVNEMINSNGNGTDDPCDINMDGYIDAENDLYFIRQNVGRRTQVPNP